MRTKKNERKRGNEERGVKKVKIHENNENRVNIEVNNEK